MEAIIILIGVIIGIIVLDATRKRIKQIKNQIRRFFRGSKKVTVSPYKKTITVNGYEYYKNKKNKRKKKKR